MFYFDHEGRDEHLPDFFKSKEYEILLAKIQDYYAKSPEEQAQTTPPDVMPALEQSDVLEKLKILSAGKCPYCERTSVELRIHHYRPPYYVQQTLGGEKERSPYLWAALVWDNMFPICHDCHNHAPDFFPVDDPEDRADWAEVGRGQALQKDHYAFNSLEKALDVELTEILHPHSEIKFGQLNLEGQGKIKPKTKLAALTIFKFDLNRKDLMKARVKQLNNFLKRFKREDLDRKKTIWRFIDKGMSFSDIFVCFLHEVLNESYVVYEYNNKGVQLISKIREYLLNSRPAILQNSLVTFKEAFQKPATSDEEIQKEFGIVRLVSTSVTQIPQQPVRPPMEQVLPTQAPNEEGLYHWDKAQLDAPYSVSGVRVLSYKSLAHIELELSPANQQTKEHSCLLILGENSAGKSSILEAIALALLPEPQRTALKLEPRDLILNEFYLGKEQDQVRDVAEIEITLSTDTGKMSDIHLCLNRDDNGFHVKKRGPNLKNRPLLFAFGAHRLYGSQGGGALSHIDTLFYDDRTLPNPEEWLRTLAEERPSLFDFVIGHLRKLIQVEGRFETIKNHNGRMVIHVKKQASDGKDYSIMQPLSMVSSGYRSVLAMVCCILRGFVEAGAQTEGEFKAARAVVLIDEIEAHLHPRWKMSVIKELRAAFPHVTFIMTSHDPLCVRGMKAGEVIMLNRHYVPDQDGDGLPERVEAVTELGDFDYMTVEQLLTSNLFQLYSTDSPQVEQDYARYVDYLGAERTGETPAGFDDFEKRIKGALPIGIGEVDDLVYQAVARYMRDRRDVPSGVVQELRVEAEKAIVDFLDKVLS